MQLDVAKRMREQWGDKPCDHPALTKEYYLGSQTGDWACNQCGASFDRAEVDRIQRARTIHRGAEAAGKLAAALRAEAASVKAILENQEGRPARQMWEELAGHEDAVKLAEAVVKLAEAASWSD